jgi:hypothetical protein
MWLDYYMIKFAHIKNTEDWEGIYDSDVYIVSGKYNNQPTVKFNFSQVSHTIGNSYKMQEMYVHYNLRKHFCSNRKSAVY